MNSNEEWGKEADPRRYYFGHSLYRRIVSMADALKCRVMSDSNVELVEEVNETMGKLVASCTPIEDTIVHKFTHRIGDYVEIPHFGRGVITAQIVARDEESGANFEMYMTDVSDSEMISVEDITPRTEEATNA